MSRADYEQLVDMTKQHINDLYINFVMQYEQPYDDDPPACELYHYTTVRGLEGILKSGMIHATDCEYLNDSSELVHGANLACKYLDTLHTQTDYTINGFTRRLKQAIDRGDLTRQVYLACFCEKGDLLSQWRAYGSSGLGYALRLEPKAPRFRANSLKRYEIAKVVYEGKLKKEMIRKVLDQSLLMFDALRKDFPKGTFHEFDDALVKAVHPIFEDPEFELSWDEDGQPITREDYVALLNRTVAKHIEAVHYNLHEYFSFMKDEGFTEEQEWRIIHSQRLDQKEADVHYRVTGNSLIPFKELPLLDDGGSQPGPFELTGIICGPNPHPRETVKAVKGFIKSLRKNKDIEHLRGNIDVFPSEIPFRVW